MKRRLLKSLLFLFTLSALTCIAVFSVSAKTVISGDFKFSVYTSSARLVSYTGSAATVKIPSKISGVKVTAIGPEAFWGCKKLTSVSIPSTVTAIGNAAFNECTSLKKVVLPSKVKSVGDGAFWYCTSLKTVIIPASVKSIGENTFRGCSKLTAYVIKDSYGEKYIKAHPEIKLGYRYMSSMKLSASSITLAQDTTKRLTFTCSPSTVYYKKATYTSSNKKVATVTAYGTIKALSCGKTTITVKSADGSGLVKKCTVKVVPGKVGTITQSSTTFTGYTLKWKAVPGATRYKIYRYNSSTKKWTGLGTTDKLYYKLKDLPGGSSYNYRVMGYTKVGKTNYCGEISNYYKASVLRASKVTGLTAKPARNYASLSWDKADNATGYRVYLYNLETKKYEYKFSTTKTSARVTGLSPATKYGFTVRSYTKVSGKTVLGVANADRAYCTTRPEYVTGLAVDPNSIYVSRLTLSWNKNDTAAGYILYISDNETNEYEPLVTITDNSITEYTVLNLEPDTSYSFVARAFMETDTGTLNGYLCDPITVTTGSRPTNATEAFDGFINAYNSTKTRTDSFSVFYTSQITTDRPEDADKYAHIYDAISTSDNIYSFVNGIENNSKKPVSSYFAPSGELTTLSYEDINSQSLSFWDDGSGYRIRFSLNEEDTSAAVNSLIAPLIDWEAVSSKDDGFVLSSCRYTGTVVEAKIVNGQLHDLQIITPVTVNFTLDGTSYSFSKTLSHTYGIF